MRIISLVPSLTDALDHLGAADHVIGVTRYCTHGAPPSAEVLGGTKNPDVQRVIALRPDLVLTNTEENRAADIQRLRDAGLVVEETYPRTVRDASAMLRRLGEVLADVPGVADTATSASAQVDTAIDRAIAAAPEHLVMALTLVWRKPWMGLGPDTYASDLLATCGFGNVLSGFDEPYPTLDPSFVLGPDVVLLPSEPYAFTETDLAAVDDLVGTGTGPQAGASQPLTRFVDGQALTWHGTRTARAIDIFSALAGELRATTSA